MENKKILILGGTGMLGHMLLRQLSSLPEYSVYATARNFNMLSKYFPANLVNHFRPDDVDAIYFDSINRALASIQPNIVINCIGLIKQKQISSDPLSAITVNAQLPHRLSMICRTANARFIQISTDCVFNGSKGMYKEEDESDAKDLYGKTKFLGEVTYPHCITLRTSIIGHELKGRHSLIEWFLSQDSKIRGFTKAIYSGFPTVELAKIISDFILPNSDLKGLYHVSAEPISKFNLLKFVAERYSKEIDIEPYSDFQENRSLDSQKFRNATGYKPPDWPELVDMMFKDYESNRTLYKK